MTVRGYRMLAGLAASGVIAACATLAPPGDQMVGMDAAALVEAYGQPVSRGPAPDGPPGAERILFAHPAHVAFGTEQMRSLSRCDRLGYAAGVIDELSPGCVAQQDWTQSGETIPVNCSLRFTLGPDGKVTAFVGEPAGCDVLLAHR